MVMEGKQWKEILSVIDKEEDLSKDNVIKRIKKKLEVKDKNEYEKRGKAGFSVNYLFQFTFYGKAIKCTLLYLAALQVRTEIVKVLLQAKGIDVNAAIENGMTSLHLAAIQNCTEIVKILIAKGAKVDAVEKDGHTPLHLAATFGRTETVKILIENGADYLLQDNDGKTPRDLAQDDVIKKLLEEAEETQLRKRAFIYGGSTAVLGAAIAVALFATETIAVELIPIVIAVVAVATAALAVGGITYMMSKPSTKVEEAEEEKTAGNGSLPSTNFPY